MRPIGSTRSSSPAPGSCDLLRIALAQIDPTVGDLAGNSDRIRDVHARAAVLGADLVIFPELAITGYPSEDLIVNRSFHTQAVEVLQALAGSLVSAPALLVGTPWSQDGCLYNAAALLERSNGVTAVRYKHELPNYGVFDEERWFTSGMLPEPVDFHGLRLGVMICEDMWKSQVALNLKQQGADILVVLNSSPFELGKYHTRLALARSRVSETAIPLLYVNQVGGQDELVFDGRSFAMGTAGEILSGAASFQEDLLITQWRYNQQERGTSAPSSNARPCAAQSWVCKPGSHGVALNPLEEIYLAMMTGLRDYVTKNNFPGILVGLSGGIDSALSAVVAADALGADRLLAVMMPSVYTSAQSVQDARLLADNLGCRLHRLPITSAMTAFENILAATWPTSGPKEIVAENLQARIRGTILMALANQFGLMVLATGNKSELAVGYATLYGDMCGGYSVLKDIYKTKVYELARWRNRLGRRAYAALGRDNHQPDASSRRSAGEGEVIPQRILTKAPSAELKPGQTDQDTLPPYTELDAILEALIEQELGLSEVIALGYDGNTARRVWQMLDQAEHKRRQSPPGVKVTCKALGRDRRYPITNHLSWERSSWNTGVLGKPNCK